MSLNQIGSFDSLQNRIQFKMKEMQFMKELLEEQIKHKNMKQYKIEKSYWVSFFGHYRILDVRLNRAERETNGLLTKLKVGKRILFWNRELERYYLFE